MGRQCERLPVEFWTSVMDEEIGWLKKAGATQMRYWSGGNLYPGVLEAASRAGLDVMSDYNNPRTQRDDQRLLAVNPWRPAMGPSETDLAGFARHSTTGKIIYLPNGVFERVDHSAMRRSADAGGDYPYFDALTRGLELSLRAACPDRVNVFHITVHPGEFRGGPQTDRPFAVIDDWLGKVIAPLITSLIHENDFYVRGGPSWNAIYFGPDGKMPVEPPYDLDAPDRAQPRTAENQAAIWRAYEELVAYAAENLSVVTSSDIVRIAVDFPGEMGRHH